MTVKGKGDRYEVFTVIERNGKSYWSKLGRGYLNKDGSINVFLDALPLNGKFQIRVEVKEPKVAVGEDVDEDRTFTGEGL